MKPRSSIVLLGIGSIVEYAGLFAVYLAFGRWPSGVLVLLGMGVCALGIYTIFLGAGGPSRIRITVGLSVGVVIAAAATLFVPLLSSIPQRSLQSVAAAVCEGETNPSSPRYRTGAAPYPMLLTPVDGDRPDPAGFEALLPQGGLAKRAQEAQLVACIEYERWDLVETCRYTTSKGVRIKERLIQNVRVRLIEMATAEVVGVKTIRGGSPPKCPYMLELSASGSETDKEPPYYGEVVGPEPIAEWLQPFIEGRAG
jgi:hypothetical protein